MISIGINDVYNLFTNPLKVYSPRTPSSLEEYVDEVFDWMPSPATPAKWGSPSISIQKMGTYGSDVNYKWWVQNKSCEEIMEVCESFVMVGKR